MTDIYLTSGEVRIIAKQWAQETERAGTTVSSSTWTYDGSSTLASQTLVTPLVTVKITPTTSGILTNKATFANGEIRYATWDINVSV